MQFNSFVYILLFLPLTVLIYFLACRFGSRFGKIVLIIAGIIFYLNAGTASAVVLLISIAVNYCFALLIGKKVRSGRLCVMIPVIVNIVLLLGFKYTGFAVLNANRLLGTEFPVPEIFLPLGISFFTFQQIAYVASVYKGETDNVSMIDYLAYILYFPKLIMGPLMEPSDFLGQINDNSLKKPDMDNIACGLKIFSYGLFKKVMIADILARAVSWGYENIEASTSVDWILIMLFYTFEIYFDFSGYSDMAVGSSLMLNITLPINFDSPYKALSIRDFWKRWHISLTSFFTKYIYIPLGGSRKGKVLTYVNVMVVFLISGLWHGASWTFVLWGFLHGVLMVFDRIFDKWETKIFEPLRWMITFLGVSILWLLFRSESVMQWAGILKKILFFGDRNISDGVAWSFYQDYLSEFLTNTLHIRYLVDHIWGFWMLLYLFGCTLICLGPRNNYRKLRTLSPVSMIFAALLFVWGLTCLGRESVFLYFNF